MSPFYNLLVDCWKKGMTDETKLKTFVPLFISEEERQMIIETPKQ